MKRLSSKSGVTLIEVLIAVSLLSLLSVGVLMAMRIGFNTMEKTDNRLVHNRRVANSRKIIENEIYGFIATFAQYRPAPDAVLSTPFLEATPQAMRFVTAYSLENAWRGRPQIAIMQVAPGEGNRGVRLIVNETPYTGPAQAGEMIAGIESDPATGDQIKHFAPVAPGAQSFVLADQLAYCRFEYLEPLIQPPFQIWRPVWVNARMYPTGVRIDMAPLDTESRELHVSSVTVPFNVNKSPMRFYADR